MVYWVFFIDLTCLVILFISKKCISFLKNVSFIKMKINSEYTDTFQICEKNISEENKYITVTDGNKRGRMATYIQSINQSISFISSQGHRY